MPIGMEESTKLQSRELCFPMEIVLAKDCEQLYNDFFKEFFEFF